MGSVSTWNLFDRYLGVLGIEPGEPSSSLLAELVSAQLVTAPFENISKLYRFRTRGSTTITDLRQYLDGIEGWRLGGTCYVNNYHLFSLLDRLGFEVSLCGADMNHPDVHMVSMVKIEGREFMVDVGYAAPFFRPLPRDLDELIAVIELRFGVPADVVRSAVVGVDPTADIYS